MDRSRVLNALCRCAKGFYGRGWMLGTSGNISALVSEDPVRVLISASGNPKGEMNSDSFLEVNGDGNAVSGIGRASAETCLHLTIYWLRPGVVSVMHTHSVWGTVLSDLFLEKGSIEIEGYEMLKGLSGVDTHEHIERIPVIENSQDYTSLSKAVENVLEQNRDIHGIYLRRHGLYTWGTDIAEAQRHVEILEFLFEAVVRRLQLEQSA
ncbi:MAG: methylthioribulose 1-phosphate dehydratase [Pyrinomonadaceae bacterium]|nr:methylthioribulose 1-phosphate dehydratase [Pyrinomonadaceae bacterium]